MYIKNQKYLDVCFNKMYFYYSIANESNFNNSSHCDYDSCV